jgi:hypothetical protein
MPLFFNPDHAGAVPFRMTRAFHPGWDPLFTDGVDPGTNASDAPTRGPLFRARGGNVSNLKLHRDDEDVKEPPAPLPFPSAADRLHSAAMQPVSDPSGLSPEHHALVSDMDAVFEQMGSALDALAQDLDTLPFPNHSDDDDDGPWAA